VVGEEEFHDSLSDDQTVNGLDSYRRGDTDLASWTRGVLVNTLEPGMAGIALWKGEKNGEGIREQMLTTTLRASVTVRPPQGTC
jgi:hypothetical protein